MNALTGQKTAIVSDIPGTTADPVRKAMEIPGIGPCLFIDTAGFDDSGTALGRKRTRLSAKALESADIAIMIFRDCDNAEKEWYGRMTRDGIPVIPVIGKADLHGGTGKDAAVEEEVRKLCGESPVMASAATLQGIDLLFRAILEKIPGEFGSRTITGDLVKEGDTILLVMPQDGLAPKGRLILPQVQVIRELLDRKCTAVSCTPDTMGKALSSLACPPGLIITDSQAFEEVAGMKPEGSRLTSFSILFAGYKGDIRVFREGAEAALIGPLQFQIVYHITCLQIEPVGADWKFAVVQRIRYAASSSKCYTIGRSFSHKNKCRIGNIRSVGINFDGQLYTIVHNIYIRSPGDSRAGRGV